MFSRRFEVRIEKTDILVIGSGIAGLLLAHKVAESAAVVIVTKKEGTESNTYYAQGGIAAVADDEDSFELHIKDTLEAGQGLCHPDAVEIMVREGPIRIRELAALGVRFNRDEASGSYRLGREGGHSASRILHYHDVIGRELEEVLLDEVEREPNVSFYDQHLAIDLVIGAGGAICGCYVLDRIRNEVVAFLARHTVIATGGAGKIYLYTSNPDVASGDGMAMAYRAGAEISNLEFVQFHPTSLYHPRVKSLLISEALRGEGARLRTTAGDEFMAHYDDRRELAPRDIVARAIDSEMKKSGEKYVLLDITHRSAEWLRGRFPFVYERCLDYGIDISREPIPVVPAAHYMCGGVRVDMEGKTNLPGLSAIGEAACSGVHGANRLASNSLLEAIVLSHRCAERLKSDPGVRAEAVPDMEEFPRTGDPETLETVILDHDWDLTRRVMWDYVGIVRSEERLHLARSRIGQILETVERLYAEYGVSLDMVELRNIALVSSLVIESAISRKESRGLHYMIEYPAKDPEWERDSIIQREGSRRGGSRDG
jgi:L-aspartate oxidase